MVKRWLMIAMMGLLTACAGQYGLGGRDKICNDAAKDCFAIDEVNDCRFNSDACLATQLLEVHRLASEHGSVSEPFPIRIQVTALQNVSDVVITDTFSDPASILGTSPPAEVTDGEIVWKIDSMDCGDTVYLEATLKSDVVGCLVDCIKVSALPRLCVSTYVGKCNLSLEKMGPECLCLGSSGYYTIVVRNDGSRVARDVIVTDSIPEGMEHASGDQEVTWMIGDLESGYSQTMSLCLDAKQLGTHRNVASVTSSSCAGAQTEMTTLVSVAGIDVTISGTKEQLIGKNASYAVTATNTGDEDLCDVVVIDTFSRCATVAEADGGCVRDGSVSWMLDCLRPGETRSWNVVLNNCTPNTLDSDVHARGTGQCCGCVEARDEMCTIWKGHAGLLIEMVDTCDPMLVGECGSYQIRVTNQGTADDEEVVVVAIFPKELKPLEACGELGGTISGQTVTFDSCPTLGPCQYIDYTINTKAIEAGDARVKVELHSKLLQQPVTEEESTYIY